jgi:TPR repeat protein
MRRFVVSNRLGRALLLLWLTFAVALAHAAEVDIASLQQGAAAGNAYDQLNLGAAYDNAIGVARDIDQALYWYQKAAEQGVAEAQFNLAHLLVTEELSAVAAAEWMRKAADQGMVDAEYLMGVIYAEGIGVEVDRAQAEAWLKKAAAKGHAEAKRLLTEMGPLTSP